MALNHIGIIMDGNRRWAKKRLMPVGLGHLEGARRIEPLVEHAAKRGIKYLTFWAFSTENWKREKEELEALMDVFRKALHDPSLSFQRLKKNDVRVQVIGDLAQFPQDIIDDVQKIVDETANNTKITVNFALNYGGRNEILRAVNTILHTRHAEFSSASRVTERNEILNPSKGGQASSSDLIGVQDDNVNISEEEFGKYLYTSGMPDPDLIIRTGGEKRLSGFLTWQSVYSELYFVDTLWPDFKEKELDKAIEDYEARERRFGK